MKIRTQIAWRAAALGIAFGSLINAGVYDRPLLAAVSAVVIFLAVWVPLTPAKKAETYRRETDPDGWEEYK